MKAWNKLKRTWGDLNENTGAGVEFFIEGCASVQGCRLAVYKEAQKFGARLITTRVEDAISSQNGGLMIKLGFQDDSTLGQFLHEVGTWCEFHNLTMVPPTFVDDAKVGRKVSVADYKETDTNSPPGARARSRSRDSEESLRTYVTEIVDRKDEQCVFQSLENPERYNAMDSCHLLSHSECKGTLADSDASNRVAASTGFHRAFDGTSERYPPWVRIEVVSVDQTPVHCEGKGGRAHHRFRVNLAIDFMTDDHRESHRFCWKDGTTDDKKNPVSTFVYVEDYVMFCNGVEWKHKDTTKIWNTKVG